MAPPSPALGLGMRLDDMKTSRTAMSSPILRRSRRVRIVAVREIPMKRFLKTHAPHLTFALALLAGTGVSVALQDQGAWVLAGPALLALAALGAAGLARRLGDPAGPPWLVASIQAGVILAAGTILMLRDPSRVPEAVPILGATGFFLLPGTTCRSSDAGVA